jgi:hypothetical protein
MNKFDPASVHLQIPNRRRRNVRASDLVNEAAYKYNILKKNLEADQTIDLTCCIAGRHYPVASLSPYSEECLYIITAEFKGAFSLIFCPLEQASLFISVSKKIGNKPPREIGFHAIGRELDKH